MNARAWLFNTSFIILGLPIFATADVNGDLQNFFNNAGFTSNVSSPAAYQGQEAGYYTGGSLFLQSSSRYVQPVGITLPSINAGCGGIDIFSGGMSFINSAQINQFAQDVMSNAAGYTLHLAIATWAPQINQVLQFVQDQAQNINSFGMSSCQAAEDLVGGVWSMAGQNMGQVCRDMGTATNKAQGWVQSQEGCSTDPQSTINQGQAQGVDPNALQPNTNFAWKALTNYGLIAQDQALSEFLMTVSGTIIMDKDSNPHYVYPQFKDGTIIDALVNGGTANVYHCDEPEKCLNPTLTSITISTGLLDLTKNDITILWTSMQSDSPISSSTQQFLSQVNLPVMTILQTVSMTGQSPDAIIAPLSEYLAYYLLNQYLQWSLDTVNVASKTLDISKDVMGAFHKNIEDGQQYLQHDLSLREQEYADQLQGFLTNSAMMRQVMGKATPQQMENLQFESGE